MTTTLLHGALSMPTQSLSIGRWGRYTALEVNLGTASIRSLSVDGDVVTVSGIAEHNTKAEARAMRDVFRALDNDVDEPVKPALFDEAPELDGYYRVLSARVGTVDAAAHAKFRWSWQAVLRAVASAKAPRIESQLSGGLRTNTHAIDATEMQPFIVVPGFDTSFDPDTALGAYHITDETLGTFVGTSTGRGVTFRHKGSFFGDQIVIRDDGTLNDSSSFTDDIISYYCTPDAWYGNAVRISYDYSGSGDWIEWQGRQINPNPERIRLTNGLVRLTVATGADSSFDIEVISATDDATETWESSTSFRMENNSGGSIGGQTYAVSIVYYGPELAIIRAITKGNTAGGPRQYDFALRRGSLFVTVTAQLTASGTYRVAQSNNEAGTESTDGTVARTSVDANGHKWAVMSPDHTAAADGITITPSTTTTRFAVGFVPGWAGTYESADNLMRQYLCTMRERLRVVER